MTAKAHAFLSGAAWLFLVMTAPADLLFTLTPAVQSGVATPEAVFTATLTVTNTSDPVYLNDLQIEFAGAATNYLTANTNTFFANVPGLMLPGETYSDVVLAVGIEPATPADEYFGTATIRGGANDSAADELTSQVLQISLSRPAIRIAPSGPDIVLSWPAPLPGFTLRQSVDPGLTQWVTVTNAPFVTNGEQLIIVTPSAGREYYRLQNP